MEFNLKENIGAKFKLTTSKADGRICQESGWFDNVVLDVGIDRMLSETWGNGVAVGSGNSTPVKTQTALDNLIAFTTTQLTYTGGIQVTDSPMYEYLRVTYRFGEGVAAGSISEVGVIQQNATRLWNRALVTDPQGNPTTITVLSDEFLDVTVEIRHYMQPKFTTTFPYLNKQGVKIRDIVATVSPYYTSSSSAGMSRINSTSHSSYSGTSNPDSPTSVPVSAIANNTVTSGATTKVSSNMIRSVHKASLTVSNGSIKSLLFRYDGFRVSSASAASGYKVEFDTPIEKTAEMELSYSMTLTITST